MSQQKWSRHLQHNSGNRKYPTCYQQQIILIIWLSFWLFWTPAELYQHEGRVVITSQKRSTECLLGSMLVSSHCLLVSEHPSNMLVYIRDGSAQTSVHAATLRQKLQIKLSLSPSHSILTPHQPVPVLTLWCQAPGRVATGVPMYKSLVWLDLDKSPRRKRESNPGLPLLRLMP